MDARPEIDSGRLTAWYDVQAPFYHAWRDDYDATAVRQVLALLTDVRGTVLDVGCGTGLLAVALARALPACRIIGLDLSRGMLQVAAREAERAALSNVCFLRGNAETLPFARASLAAVVAGGLMANLNDRSRVIAEMARVVQARGRLVLTEFDNETAGTPLKVFVRFMTLGQRIVSTAFPRYRFARRWQSASSFVPPEEVQRHLRQVGCAVNRLYRGAGHYVISAARRAPSNETDDPNGCQETSTCHHRS
jgi:demethylmenaquinone methyltransferase/2-methoxy-6-polyprenyl-1,4-benzoquinol methylase